MAGDSEVPASQAAAGRDSLNIVLNLGAPTTRTGPGSRAATAAGQEGTGANEGGC